MRLHFVWIGKTRDRHCAALIDDYLERIKRFVPYEVSELKEQAGGDEKRVVAAESEKLIAASRRTSRSCAFFSSAARAAVFTCSKMT